MRPRALVVLAVSVGLSMAVPSPAHAWGAKGHRIVARIAAAHLSPRAAVAVADLLVMDTAPGAPRTLEEAAVWPDAIKDARPDTKPWHFVNIPVAETHYVATRDCPGATHQACLIARIEQFRRTLKSATAPPTARLDALTFLAHLLGDLHQPLHCADDHDGGGTGVPVRWFGKKMTLHALWDTGLIDRAGVTPEVFANELLTHVEPVTVASLQASTFIQWAEASHRLAITHAYALPANRLLGRAYYKANAQVVDEQLTKAGLRLARILNESF